VVHGLPVGPNLAIFNRVRVHARPDAADQQWAIIAPRCYVAGASIPAHRFIVLSSWRPQALR
jgi:hypothetical protein